MVLRRSAKRALYSGRHVDAAFARGEFEKMFPRAASGLIARGEVDTSHHERFEEPDDEKFKPAPFGANGELMPGDERFLFDNSLHDEKPQVFAHSITQEGGSVPGEHDLRYLAISALVVLYAVSTLLRRPGIPPEEGS